VDPMAVGEALTVDPRGGRGDGRQGAGGGRDGGQRGNDSASVEGLSSERACGGEMIVARIRI
jgi:hypothetical protein